MKKLLCNWANFVGFSPHKRFIILEVKPQAIRSFISTIISHAQGTLWKKVQKYCNDQRMGKSVIKHSLFWVWHGCCPDKLTEAIVTYIISAWQYVYQHSIMAEAELIRFFLCLRSYRQVMATSQCVAVFWSGKFWVLWRFRYIMWWFYGNCLMRSFLWKQTHGNMFSWEQTFGVFLEAAWRRKGMWYFARLDSWENRWCLRSHNYNPTDSRWCSVVLVCLATLCWSFFVMSS
jgi:hypothetical protein